MISSNLPFAGARVTLDRSQKVWFGILLFFSFCLFVYHPYRFLWTLNIVLTLFYLLSCGYKFLLVSLSVSRKNEIEISPQEISALKDENLPVYTILLPVYQETEVLPQLFGAIGRLDYPAEKLDVKFLVEASDCKTIDVLNNTTFPPNYEVVTVSDVPPRTKPNALNHGLAGARGDYLVVYDAEDIPETDQLKKSILAFSLMKDDRVICLQAKLNYYNPNQNFLTRWFTAEYAMWFDLYLPGMDFLKVPIPLGGTSNHFKTGVLRELGGWDAYNVAEDCDLGIRIFRKGYRTRILNSTTWEEANCQLPNWLRQRSRWIKGYLQTYLVHLRHPIFLLRQLGWKNFASFHLTVGGHPFILLINPLYWVLTVLWIGSNWGKPFSLWFPAFYYCLVTPALLIGNLIFVALNVLGCVRRKFFYLVKSALVSPVYWLMMSIGGWKGTLQLFHNPHYWDKTVHGLCEKVLNWNPPFAHQRKKF